MSTSLRPEQVALDCPICGGSLYLITTQLHYVYADGSIEKRVSDDWHLECQNDHKPWLAVDQVRFDNEAGITEDDETGDYMPDFKPEAYLRFRDAKDA